MTVPQVLPKRLRENEIEMSGKTGKRQKPANSKANQNSAAVLSLWHCILAWFYMSCERDHTKDRHMKLKMNEVYHNMRAIRTTIHHNSQKVDSMVVDFNELVKKFNQETWNSVIKSMLHELMEMLRVLKDDKDDFLKAWEFQEMDEVEKRKFKHLSCLLTIWYWLAAWSDPSGESQQMKSAKDHYFRSMESCTRLLNSVLFMDSHDVDHNEEETSKNFTVMIKSLVKLLRADPQHWIDVLDHFLNRMAHAGSLRGQVKNVWEEARAIRDDEIENPSNHIQSDDENQQLSKEYLPEKREIQIARTAKGGSSAPNMLVHGLGFLLKQVARRTPLSIVADKIPDAVSLVYDDLKKGDIKDLVDHIPNVVGEFVGPEGKQIAEAVVKGAEYVGEHVVEGVKEIGHVLGEGVHEFSKGVSSAFHSVKSFFSHLF